MRGKKGENLRAKNEVATLTKQSNFSPAALSGDFVEWDLDTAQVAVLIISSNTTINNPKNQRPGGKYTIIIKPTGNYYVAWANAYNFQGGNVPDIYNAGNGAVIIIDFVSDGYNMYGSASASYAPTTFEAVLDELGFDNVLYAITAEKLGATSANNTTGGIVDENFIAKEQGDTVYLISDGSKYGHRTIQTTAGRAATLRYDQSGKPVAFYLKRGSGNTTNMFISNSTKAFLEAMNTDAEFTVMMKLKSDTTGVAQRLLNSNGSSSSNAGFSLSINTSNQIGCSLFDGTANKGTLYTFTTTLNATPNWIDLIIRARGDSVFVQVDGTVQGKAITVASLPGTATAHNQNMTIGKIAGTDSEAFYGAISCVIIADGYASDDAVTAFRNYTPQPGYDNHVRPAKTTSPPIYEIAPPFIHYDFSDTTTLWNTSARANQTGTVGETIGYVDNKIAGGKLLRDGTGGASNSPVLAYDSGNGRFCATFDGTDDAINLNLETLRAFDQTIYLVVKPDSTRTTHFPLANGANGFRIVKENTATNSADGGGNVRFDGFYTSFALSTPPSVAKELLGPAAGTVFSKTGWAIIRIRRKGNLYNVSINGRDWGYLGETNDAFSFTALGNTSTSSQDFKGQFGEVLVYNAFLDDVSDQIMTDSLGRKWGIDIEEKFDERAYRSKISWWDKYGSNDYQWGPTAVIKDDTIFAAWLNGVDHNVTADINSTAKLQAFNFNLDSLTTAVDIIHHDTVGVDRIIGMGAQAVFPDGRILLAGNAYPVASSFGGKPIIRIRGTDGVIGDTIEVDNAWTSAGGFFFIASYYISGDTIYAAGYGDNDSTPGPYRIGITYSIDDGETWAAIQTIINGATDGFNPEEPMLGKLADGRWMLLVRTDTDKYVRQAKTSDFFSWPTFTSAFYAYNLPRWIQTTDGYLICATRHPDRDEPVYYYSDDIGATWQGPVRYDNRTNDYILRQEGADIIEIEPGRFCIVWACDANTYSGQSDVNAIVIDTDEIGVDYPQNRRDY